MSKFQTEILYELVDSLDADELRTLNNIVTRRIDELEGNVNYSKIKLPVMHKPQMSEDFDFASVQKAWHETGREERQKRKVFFGSGCGN